MLPCNGQIDSLQILKKVQQLSDYQSKQVFLDEILKNDHKYRGSDKSAMNDLNSLVAISYFINTFGYPTEEEYGRAATNIPFIWVHNSFRELRQIAFPLVHTAYVNGHITDDWLRTYYLKISYQHRFDYDAYLTLPPDEIFRLIEFNTSSKIPIKNLMIAIEEIRKFQSQPIKEAQRWQAAPKPVTMVVNGERVNREKKDPAVEIFTLENCKVFFHALLADQSYEPEELVLIGERKYKFKYRQTDKYFEINTAGNLVYRDKDKILETYLKGSE